MSLVAVPFGADGDAIMVWAVLLCFGVLVWLAYRLGAELFSPWSASWRRSWCSRARRSSATSLLGYQDTPFAVLIVWAVLLEARRPRRGVPVLVLLAVAGLMRPEAWALAGLYALYVWRGATTRERVLYAGLTALAPVLWALSDWLVTGDALHSLHGTAALAETVDRRRDPLTGPYWTAKYLGYTLREPLVVGIPIGLAFAYRQRLRGAILPLAVAAAMLAVFLASPFFGLPLIGRYVRTPAVLLALFYGLAVFGWRMLPPGDERRRWVVAGVLAAALSVAFLPWHVKMLSAPRRPARLPGRLLPRPARGRPRARRPRGARRCGPIATADQRPIPHLRWWLEGDPGTVAPVADRAARARLALLLLPRRTRRMRRFYRENFPTATRPAGSRLLYRNASWRVFAAPGCTAR